MLPAVGFLRRTVGMWELTTASVLQAECEGRSFTNEETILSLDKWDTMAVRGCSSGGSCCLQSVQGLKCVRWVC